MITPCIGICKIDPVTRLCLGCLRSIDEIASWSSITDQQRLEIMQQLETRK